MEHKNTKLTNLPSWDLSDLYPSPDSPQIMEDFEWLKKAIKKFESTYKGKLNSLSAKALLNCIREHEEIDKKIARIMSFSSLRYYQKTDDASRVKFLADNEEKLTEMTTGMLFFFIEFNRIPEKNLKKMLKDNKELTRYSSAFRRMRANKPHQLSD